MPLAAARALAATQKEAGQWESREQFIASLASLCTLYPNEVERISPGPNRKIIEILMSGAKRSMQNSLCDQKTNECKGSSTDFHDKVIKNNTRRFRCLGNDC